MRYEKMWEKMGRREEQMNVKMEEGKMARVEEQK